MNLGSGPLNRGSPIPVSDCKLVCLPGSIQLSAVAEMLDSATRDELKSECGGVQTLLRNHNHIFQGQPFTTCHASSFDCGKKSAQIGEDCHLLRIYCFSSKGKAARLCLYISASGAKIQSVSVYFGIR